MAVQIKRFRRWVCLVTFMVIDQLKALHRPVFSSTEYIPNGYIQATQTTIIK